MVECATCQLVSYFQVVYLVLYMKPKLLGGESFFGKLDDVRFLPLVAFAHCSVQLVASKTSLKGKIM